MHLQVAAVLLEGGTRECRIREHAPDFGAAEKMPPKLASPLDVCAAVALFDRLFDGRRLAGLQNLADDSCRAGPDAGDPRQRAVRADQIGQRHVEREDRRGGPLVAEHLLLRRLCERQIAQISADDGVDVCVGSGPLHRHRTHLRCHARGGTSAPVPTRQRATRSR